MARLVCISNRLPMGENPSGGLVVALHDALSESGGLWIGHSGDQVAAPKSTLDHHGGAAFDRASFDLSPDEHLNYYLGYCNSVIWPNFHGRADLMEINPDYLSSYRAVNTRIAAMIAPELRDDDIIWIQDYHLMPLAAALRDLGITSRIGFFLHIPFPAPADAAALPNAPELLDWLAQFDLIGFQAERDVTNFTDTGHAIGKVEALDGGHIRLQGRVTRVAACPIGIDADQFADLARAAPNRNQLRTLTGADLMIGVDRLDYSKGIPHRFRGFEKALELHEDLHEQLCLLQIAPPTRQEVAAYQDIREETEHLAGRINGRFATLNWTPIRYIHRPIPRAVLAGLYRQSAIGLVTPLADGMNLVAKEYVAAQDTADPGVLILSRFAGAAEQMDQALLVNPHDSYEMAEAITQALRMPLAERQARHAALWAGVASHDVHWWSQNYLSQLAQTSLAA